MTFPFLFTADNTVHQCRSKGIHDVFLPYLSGAFMTSFGGAKETRPISTLKNPPLLLFPSGTIWLMQFSKGIADHGVGKGVSSYLPLFQRCCRPSPCSSKVPRSTSCRQILCSLIFVTWIILILGSQDRTVIFLFFD